MIPGIQASRRRTWERTAGMIPLCNLEFEGDNGGTNFVDEVDQTIFIAGSPAISTAQKYNGNSSGLFNGTNQAISYSNLPFFDLGTGDWRLRLAFYPTAIATDREMISRRILADNLNFWSLRLNSNARVRFFAYTSGSFVTDVTTTGLATVNAWNVLDIRRTSGSVSINLNGGTGISGTNLSGAYPAPSVAIQVARADPSGAGTYFPGYLDSFLLERAP